MKILFFFLLAAVMGRAENLLSFNYDNGATVRVTAPIPILPATGFFPVRVELNNPSGKDMSWAVESNVLSNRFSGRGSRGANTTGQFSLSCPGSETRVVELLIPVPAQTNSIYGQDRRLNMTIKSSEFPDANQTIFFDRHSNLGSPCVGLSKSLVKHLSSELDHHFFSSSRYSGTGASHGRMIDKGLPGDWRAYQGYDILIFRKSDILALSASARIAIDQWVIAGGTLTLIDTTKETAKAQIEHDGFGLRINIDSNADLTNFDASNFDQIIRRDSTSQSRSSASDYSRKNWAVAKDLGSRSMQSSLFLLLLLVFAVIVGPINLFIWANKTRRHRLFITTPLISFVASILLLGLIVVRDGLGGDGTRAIAIDVGGPGSQSAAVLQEQFSRTGILLSSGFEISKTAALTPVAAPLTDYNREQSVGHTGDFSFQTETTKEGIAYSGELFSSRSESAQLLREVRPSRERLELIASADGTPRITSSFSYDLKNVFYRAPDRTVWRAESISPGETVSLTASTLEDQESAMLPVIGRFGFTNNQRLTSLIARPNSFSALSTEAPGIPSHGSIDWQSSPVLITGTL